jgi:hypothetical protein
MCAVRTPSGSNDARPSKVMDDPAVPARSGPAFATGSWLVCAIVVLVVLLVLGVVLLVTNVDVLDELVLVVVVVGTAPPPNVVAPTAIEYHE